MSQNGHYTNATAREQNDEQRSEREHTGLRTFDGHYSAHEVYRALHCPYPGTAVLPAKDEASADKIVTDGGTGIEVVPDGSRRHLITARDAANGCVSVPIDDGQYLCDGAMKVALERDRGGYRSGPSAREKLAFCIRQLENAETFAAPVGWQTGLVEGLSVEEVISALLHAHDELERFEGNPP